MLVCNHRRDKERLLDRDMKENITGVGIANGVATLVPVVRGKTLAWHSAHGSKRLRVATQWWIVGKRVCKAGRHFAHLHPQPYPVSAAVTLNFSIGLK